MSIRLGLFFLLFLFSACGYHIRTPEYIRQYAHLDHSFSSCECLEESPYFLTMMVEARHIDYSNPRSFFKTLSKHPSDGSKNCDVGHAWIYLQGYQDGKLICFEGGHSGESGLLQPKYMEGVFLQYEQYCSNPISYLWQSQADGYFQEGSGGHYPTFGAKIDLSKEQFEKILKFIQLYDYSDYAITGNQCSSFVAQIAAFVGLDLECEITMYVNQYVDIGGQMVCLWEDPTYSVITFSSPDQLEKSLMEVVRRGQAEYALDWYKKKFLRRKRINLETLQKFPERLLRYITI